MTDEGKALKREYMKQWKLNNKEKVKAAEDRYWDKLAKEKVAAYDKLVRQTI